MNRTDSFKASERSPGQPISKIRGIVLWLAAGLILLAEASFAGLADKDSVDGHIDLDVGRTELRSCVAYPDRNRLVISIEAFEHTDKDLEAYLKQGVYRDIALVDVEEGHAIPGGYQRHPGIGAALIFDEAVSYETRDIVDSDVGLSGTGKQGDMYSGLLSRHYDLKIKFLSEALVAGSLRSAGSSYRFQVDFECPIVRPAQ